MRIGKESKKWIRAAVIGVVLGPTTVSAEFPRPLETAGRLHGVCWGDGYHACASSGVRLGADLPPKSYSASYGARSQVKPMGIVHRIGATYYDRFDAANARACGACAPNAIRASAIRASAIRASAIAGLSRRPMAFKSGKLPVF